MVLQLGLECSRLLQLEVSAGRLRPGDGTSTGARSSVDASLSGRLSSICKTRGSSMGSLAEVWRLVVHRRPVSWFWPVVIRICASWGVDGVLGC